MTFHENHGIESQHLVRGLSLLDATMIVVGSMIGSGIFIVSAESSRLVGAPGWLLVAWALAGVLMIVVLTFTNTRGLKTGKLIQNTFTFTKTAALVGLIVIGLTLGWRVGLQHGAAAFSSSWWNPTLNGWRAGSAQVGFGGKLVALALAMLL